ncbi:MAG TPA: substrate-binding domain-containing protein, partial [Polyangiaceae bacterium]|nr:substrate-binding domain-containing protein [Polyangiaceae bacterium]
MATGAPNHVRAAREARAMTQLALAEAAGISRQSLSAIEAGRADPSVAIALRLARALERPVEELFGDADEPPHLRAELAGELPPGRRERVVLAFVGGRWVAHPAPPMGPGQGAVPADGFVVPGKAKARITVEPLRALAEARDNVLLLGCAPALGLLAGRLNRSAGPGHFVWLPRPSRAALAGLDKAHAHAAGVHLREGEGEPNVAAVRRYLPKRDVSLTTFVRWETGLALRPGNPLSIGGVADLVRPGLRVVAREPGSGTQ